MTGPWAQFKRPEPAATPASSGPWDQYKITRPNTAVPSSPSAPSGSTWGEVATDTARGVGGGLAGLAGSMAQLANLASGGTIDRHIVRPAQAALDRALGGTGQDSGGIAGGHARIREGLDAGLSADMQERKQRQQEAIEAAGDGAWDRFKAGAASTLRDPRLLGQYASEQVPQLFAGGALARGAMAGKGATEAAVAAARKTAERRLIGFSAAQGGGYAGQEAMQDAMQLPDEVWQQNPEFQRLAAEVGPERAKEQLTLRAGQIAATISAPISAAAGALTAPLERAIFTGTLRQDIPRLLSRDGAKKVAAAVGKEAVEEMVQEGGEQFAGNVGVRTIDPTRSLTEGVPESAGIGAALGGAVGGGMVGGGLAISRPRPYPDARPGSLQDAANEAAAAAPTITRPQPATAAAEAEPAAAEARAETPAAATGPRPTQTVLPPLDPPWFDPATGEVSIPTDTDLRAMVRRQRDQQQQALNSDAPLDAEALADYWGVPPARVQAAIDKADELDVDAIKAELRTLIAAGRQPDKGLIQQHPGLTPQKLHSLQKQVQRELAQELVERTRAGEQQSLPIDSAPQQEVEADGRGDRAADAEAAGSGLVQQPGEDVGGEATREPVAGADLRQDEGADAATAAADRTGEPDTAAEAAGVAEPATAATPTEALAREAAAEERQPSIRQEEPAAEGRSEPREEPSLPSAASTQANEASLLRTPAAEPARVQTEAAAEDTVSSEQATPAPASAQAEAPASRVEAAAAEAATSPTNDRPEPTQAQKEAGNYAKGRVSLHGMGISIENPAGTRRRPEWPPLAHHYGYIRRTEGADGDHIDVFLTERAEDPTLPVFVIDQRKPDGTFDEVKVVLGTASEAEARAAYMANYSKGWKGLGAVTRMTLDQFKAWAADPVKSKKPASRERKRMQAEQRAGSDQAAVKQSAVAAAADQRAEQREAAAPTDVRRALRADRALRAAFTSPEGASAPEPDTAPARDFVDGWNDAKAGRPIDETRLSKPTAAMRIDGFNPVDSYLSGYESQRAGEPRRLRTVRAQPAATPAAAAQRTRKPKKPSHADQAAVHFVPGRVVRGYTGFDEVLAFNRAADGTWSVTVHEVRELDGRWVRVGKPHDARTHSTMPSERDLASGPVATLDPLPGGQVPYTEPRADGKPFPNAPARGPEESAVAQEGAAALFSLPPAEQQAFDRWFEGSQVVDAAGNPLTLYHGTGEDFTVFRKDRSGASTGHATAPFGFFFTPDRKLAEGYARKAADGVPAFERVVDVHLAIRNPFRMTLEQAQSFETRGEAVAFREWVEARGFDGIQIGDDTWVAFQPGQIKSASGNRGTWDASNPDIRYSLPSAIRKGLAAEQVQRVVDRQTAAWREGPVVRVVDSAEKLPSDAKRDPRYKTAEGYYNGHTVWLVAPNLVSTRRVAQVLAHEAIGHYGVDRVVGIDEWQQIERAIADLEASGRGSVRMREVLRDVRARYGDVDPRTFAMESIAVMAERGVRNSLMDRVVRAVRRFLRQWMPNLQWSEAELRQLLVRSERLLQDGETAAQRYARVGAVAFSQDGRPAPPFYSALTAAVEAGRGAPRKADAAAWKQWLDGAQRRGEFRQSERDWLGLDAWLDGRESTTRAELAEFVRANEVQVQDVVLGNLRDGLPEGWVAQQASEEQLNDGYDAWVVLDEDGALVGSGDTRATAIRNSRSEVDGAPTATKFGNYRTPGGANYRELLLTLPRRESEGAPAADDGTLDQFALRPGQPTKVRAPEYRSAHWDQPNVLAHVRFDERTDADGKRVLFLQEIQSDWHQEGRRKGYAGAERARLNDALREYESLMGRMMAGGIQSLTQAERARVEELRPVVRGQGRPTDGVADAPFKATDEWAMLAFKRMARWAVDNGFDRIAWTTGDMAAELFDLSKQIDELRVLEISRDQYEVTAKKDGKQVIEKRSSRDDLPALIGKEMADKALRDIEQAKNPGPDRVPKYVATYSGLDLKVGGAGMRGFYDRILPSAVGKWGKRFGAKVGVANIEMQNQPLAADIDEYRFAIHARGDAEPHALYRTEAEARQALQTFADPSLLEVRPYSAEADKAKAAEPAGTVDVHAIDITPAMREAVATGQPLFSLPPSEAIDRIESALKNPGARALEYLKGKIEDWRPKWLGFLNLRMLADLGGSYLPQLKDYVDVVQQMSTDRNVMQEEGGEVAERWRKWAAKNRAESKELVDDMHESTIYGVDPSMPFKPNTIEVNGEEVLPTPKNVRLKVRSIKAQMRGRGRDAKQPFYDEIKRVRGLGKRNQARRDKWSELNARWQQRSPEAQQMYRDVRDMYAKRRFEREQAVIKRVQDLKLDSNVASALVKNLQLQFESARVEAPYFPLHRDGEYWISARSEDGEPTFVMRESFDDWKKAEAALRADGFKIIRMGKHGEKSQNLEGASGAFVADVIGVMKKAGAPESALDDVYQLYLRTLPDLSVRKHSIHRKGTPGYSDDAVRAFGSAMMHEAHQIARMRHSHILEGIIEMMQAHVDAMRDQTGDGGEPRSAQEISAAEAMVGELKKRHEWIMNPKDSELVSKISSIGFVWYLGLTPAAAIVNMTQQAITTFPALAAHFGPAKAMNQLLRAEKDAIRTVGNTRRALKDPTEAQAYDVLQKMGVFQRTRAHNLAGIAEGASADFNPHWALVMNGISWMYHKAEVVNREAAGMAAFRLATADGKSFDEAVKYAADIVWETHHDYSNANRARFMQSGAAKVLLMFRQYSLNMTWFMARNFYQTFKGESPQVRREAWRTLVGTMGMTGIFAGALGLPVVSVVFGLLNAAAATFGDDDEPWDAKAEFKNWLADAIGPEAATVVLFGPASRATGAEFHTRTSLSNLWWRDADRELEGRDAYFNALEQIAGPIGGIGKGFLVGKQLVDQGHVWRGIEQMVPKSIKDGMKAMRFATEGVNNLRGDQVIDDLAPHELLLQFSGFASARASRQYDVNRTAKNYEQGILDRRQHLLNAYWMATRLQDDAARTAALAKIRRFNEVNPEIAIDNKTLRRSMRDRMRYSQRAENGIVLNRRLEARVREQARFGEDG